MGRKKEDIDPERFKREILSSELPENRPKS